MNTFYCLSISFLVLEIYKDLKLSESKEKREKKIADSTDIMTSQYEYRFVKYSAIIRKNPLKVGV